MSAAKPAFIITIDTEGDDIWSRPRTVTTRNAHYLPRFQALCERFGFLPTYLSNYEMVSAPAFQDIARDALRRGVAEIGMHMHPWDSPPLVALGPRDWYDQPYSTEYPPAIVADKVAFMTRLIEDTFDVKPTSHRAGRWGFDAAYARSLAAHGYEVDCSVTPHVDWRGHPGLPGGPGGVDYTGFPDRPYRLDLNSIACAGASSLLEVPMTIGEGRRPWHRRIARHLLGRTGPRYDWLRPNGRNLPDMMLLVDGMLAQDRRYLQFTLHSSEFMPGGSPTFRTAAQIETLYAHMTTLFAMIAERCVGRTLTDFARTFCAQQASPSLNATVGRGLDHTA